MPDRRRCLVVVRGRPWAEPAAGWIARELAIVRGLGRVGPVDCWSLVDDDSEPGTAPTTPPAPVDGTVTTVRTRTVPETRGDLLRWFAVGARRRPYALTRVRLRDDTAGDLVRRADEYASVWLLDAPTTDLLQEAFDAAGVATVVDVGDVYEINTRRELDLMPRRGLGNRRRRALLHRNVGAWRRWTARVVDHAAAALVCKESDRLHLADARVVVIPNGYDLAEPVPDPSVPGACPRILFQGKLTYGPNRDAAKRLVREIAPRVAAALEGPVEVRLVGEADPAIAALATGTGPVQVTVTGYVDDIAAEVRSADLVAVPLRLGGGTRVKVIEAWAHGVPVVATTIGCEGLDAVDGVHLLVADTTDAFADACVRLLRDRGLRGEIVTAAGRHVAERFDWRASEERVAELRRTVEEPARP